MTAKDEDRVDVNALLADSGEEQRDKSADADKPVLGENFVGDTPEPVQVEEESVKDEHPTDQYDAETRAKRPALTGEDIAGHYVQPTAAFEANKGSALPVEQRDASGNVVGTDVPEEWKPAHEITGYRKLSSDEISWMNTVKQAEIDLASVAQNVKELGPDIDPRMWAMARTHFQTGFMLLNRSIAKPEDPFDDRA